MATANLSAQLAEQLSLTAVPLVAVLVLEAGPADIGLLGAAQTLPFLLLSIPLGLVADRLPRRTVVVFSEALRTLTLVLLVLLAVTDNVTFAALLLLGFLGALGTVGFTVAVPALLPALLPSELHARANARIELARSMAYAGGPAIAGALVAWAGASSTFVLAALLSAVAVLCLWPLSEPKRAKPTARSALAEIGEGARFAWCHEWLRPMLLTGMAWNLSWFVLQAAYVPYALRVLTLSSQQVGVTLGCCGLGMVFGALCAPRIIRHLVLGRAIQLGPVVSVFAMLAMTMTLVQPSAWLAGLSYFLFGAGPIVWTITTTTLRQAITPAAVLGRVGSVFLTVNAGARPLGALLGAAVGEIWGESACLWLALFGFTSQAGIILTSGLRSLSYQSDRRSTT